MLPCISSILHYAHVLFYMIKIWKIMVFLTVHVFTVKYCLCASDMWPLYKRTNKYEKLVGWKKHCKQLYDDARLKFSSLREEVIKLELTTYLKLWKYHVHVLKMHWKIEDLKNWKFEMKCYSLYFILVKTLIFWRSQKLWALIAPYLW